MTLSNTATPVYYGQFRDRVLRGEIPVNTIPATGGGILMLHPHMIAHSIYIAELDEDSLNVPPSPAHINTVLTVKGLTWQRRSTHYSEAI